MGFYEALLCVNLFSLLVICDNGLGSLEHLSVHRLVKSIIVVISPFFLVTLHCNEYLHSFNQLFIIPMCSFVACFLVNLSLLLP